jgi:hypothetical protein
MNPGFAELLKATPRDCRDVFLSAAARLGTPEQNVEKRLLGHLDARRPIQWLTCWPSAISLKGRNVALESLRADFQIFRRHRHHGLSGGPGAGGIRSELQAMSRKKRQARLDAIKDACSNYIQNTLAPEFAEIVREACAASNIESNDPSVLVGGELQNRPGLRDVTMLHAQIFDLQIPESIRGGIGKGGL